MGPLALFLLQVGVVAAKSAFQPRPTIDAARNEHQNDAGKVYPSVAPDDPRRLREIESYGNNTFHMAVGLMAKLAKADGVVSKEEVQVVEHIFADLGAMGEAKRQAVAIFQAAKDGVLTYSDLLGTFELHTRDNEGARHDLVFMLLWVACAHTDTPLQPIANLIKNACTVLRLDYQQHLATLPAWRQAADTAAQANAERVKLACEILGCQLTDSDEQVRQRHRQLVRDFHPDTIAGKGLSPEFTRFAEEKFKQIQAAYEFLNAQRR